MEATDKTSPVMPEKDRNAVSMDLSLISEGHIFSLAIVANIADHKTYYDKEEVNGKIVVINVH